MRTKNIYAIYKGDNILCIGTAKECAKILNVKESTIWWLSTPANLRRAKDNRKIAIKLEED